MQISTTQRLKMHFAAAVLRHPPARILERVQESAEKTEKEPPQTTQRQIIEEPSDDAGPKRLPGAEFLVRNIDRPQVELFNAFCVASALLLFATQTLELSSELRTLLQKAEVSITLGFGLAIRHTVTSIGIPTNRGAGVEYIEHCLHISLNRADMK